MTGPAVMVRGTVVEEREQPGRSGTLTSMASGGAAAATARDEAIDCLSESLAGSFSLFLVALSALLVTAFLRGRVMAIFFDGIFLLFSSM
ncbi:hypothetical protein E2C01_041634 [Portunus trituberculatus]|uniref:Uncharacterized protein n=1 Tax=Portunus trituberculatus TaxID=210409 RepID=A0A5B7FS84_PORTR|nr:hypothetical protein [Portunus trituberculatus]